MKSIGYTILTFKLNAIVITVLMILVSFSSISVQSTQPEILTTIDDNHLLLTASFSPPQIQPIYANDELFSTISMANTFNIAFETGSPLFPTYPMKILIPYNKEISSISISMGELIELESQRDTLQNHPIMPYQNPVAIGSDPEPFEINEEVYDSKNQIPEQEYSSYGVDRSRGYDILTLNIFPTKYEPVNNKLSYFNEISIDIELKDSETTNNMYRANPTDALWVESLVINPETIDTYTNLNKGNSLYSGGLCDPQDSYDYVIICRESISDFSGTTYTWTDFINRKQADGLQTTLITVEDIEACADYWNDNNLFNDTPALIREFLIDAYQDWGLTYVLVAGDVDGPAGIERRLMDSSAESNVEAEIYWSNLDNTFNADEDNDWGEEGDEGFDLYSDLFIGSIPCDEGIDISNWLTKNFYYADSNEKDYLDNAAFYGGDTGWSCEGDDFIDFTLYGTDNYMGPDPDADGPWPNFLGFLQGFDTWNSSNPGYEYNTSVMWTAESPNPGGWQGGSESAAIEGLKNDISADKVTILNGIAHANSDMSLDVYASSWESDYHNTKPFFIHDYGCHCGEMSGSDDGVLHSMLFHSDTELAFACIYNTGYGWGNFDTTNSSSAVQQKLFWEYCFNLSISGATNNWQLSKAQQYAKDTLAPSLDWGGSWRENIQCSTLFGDPAQLLKIPFVPEHDVMVTNLDVPSVVAHGETQIVSALIRNIGNNTETDVLVNFTVDGTVLDSYIIGSLESMESQTVSFTWNPDYGTYIVGIDAAFVDDEFDEANNEVTKTVDVIAAPVIQVTPSSLYYMAPTGATDTDSILIENLPVAENALHYTISFSGDLGGNWLSSDIQNGTIDIGGSQTITIMVDATGLDEGSYQGYVIIESNDIDDPEMVVSVDLTVVYGNDMKPLSINYPVGEIPGGLYTVNATVQNLGFYEQTDVLVNCSIFEGGIGGVILDEDFSTDPTEWTITHTEGTSWTWDSTDERMEHSWGYPNAGYLDSPVLDCSGKTGIVLSFWHYWRADYSSTQQDGYVRGSIDGGVTFPYIIDEFHHNDPGEEEAVKEYDISWADGQDEVAIRFDIYNYNDYYWRIDDFNVSAEITGPLVYSSEMQIDIDQYESAFVEFMPEWSAGNGTYGIQVSTLLPNDENNGNDVIADVVTVSGPGLSFSPNGYDFGTMLVNSSDSTSFEVWNSGVGVLSYSLFESCSWLSLSSYSGESSGEHDEIIVEINTTGLAIGASHDCEIVIDSDGGSGMFHVEVFVVDNSTWLLDVEQDLYDRGFRLMSGWDAAQEFEPSLEILSSIELYLSKFGGPTGDVTVQICEGSADGIVISETILSPGEVPSFPDYEWVIIDLPDAMVTPGETYVIVLKDAVGADTHNCVQWGWCDSYASGSGGPYDGGWFYFRKEGNPIWSPIRDWDFTFRTYGLI